MAGRVSINSQSDAFWWKQLMSMHLPSSPHAKQLPFWRKRKERTPWKAPRAQRRKRSRGRLWRIWVFFTPAIQGKHEKTVLPTHIVLSSSMFHIFLWPRPSQDPCFWPNVAAGSQEQRRKQRLLVFSSFFGYIFSFSFLFVEMYWGRCNIWVTPLQRLILWRTGCIRSVQNANASLVAASALSQCPTCINIPYALLDGRWSKILAQAQRTADKRKSSHLQKHGTQGCQQGCFGLTQPCTSLASDG